MQVLTVYDEARLRDRLRLDLERAGCKVSTAADRASAVSLARELKPALVICGLSLPNLGLRLLYDLKADPLLRSISFVFCASNPPDREDEELALALGADAVIQVNDSTENVWPELQSIAGNSASSTGRPADRDDYTGAAGGLILDRLGKMALELETVREEKKECEIRYQSILESVNDYHYSVKLEEGRPVSTIHGPGCVAVTGYSTREYEADPDLCFRMIHVEDRDHVRELTKRYFFEKKAFLPFQHRIIHKDGRVRWIRNTPAPHYDRDGCLVAIDGLVSDITEYKKLEDQFHHAQKMEAVGVLAGGIAHDFNNILTAMIGYADLLQRQLGPDHAARNNVDQIMAAVERAANLVHGLLAFSRKQVMNPRPVDLNRVIRNVEKLLSRLITEDIELRVSLTEGETIIMADPGQIDQILMNLVTNGRDAMPKGGALSIETRVMEMDMSFLNEHGFGVRGPFVQVSISDTGVGMDKQARERIFEPFYTTKPMGKGTGLGLSIVYGIVKQHNGFIEIHSEPGEGTIFMLYFPLIEGEAREADGASQLPAAVKNQTILVADDDLQVRNVIKIVLSKSGYRVIEAEDGEAAVRLFKDDPAGINLLIFDIVMPRKNGMDAYEEIRMIRDDMKVIFISGYTADVIDQKGGGFKDLNIVAKPISPNNLLQKIRETLTN